MTTADAEARLAAVEDIEQQLARMMSDGKRRFREYAAQVHPDLHPAALAAILVLVREGEQKQGALATRLHADKAQVSRLVTHLVECGLVSRQPDPDDRRATLVAATDGARRRIEEIGIPQRRMLRERLDAWHLADVQELAELLRRLNEDRPQD